ncbi:MAG: UbiD family decarboxylase [Methanocellales archaeon]|nr:UbiD family decarboxylase [Methanocellales archaeon]MDD4898054.1 UbiD family decarboxylase [Methanocellales archaeon]MDD5447189.1 UbiD family decarboxylase [Methanocellales archaeon]
MSFRDFIDRIAGEGGLVEVHKRVSSNLEAVAIAKKSGTTLFHDVDGSKVVMNLLGSRDLLSKALNIPRKEIAMRLSKIKCGKAIVTEDDLLLDEISKPDLSKLPILTHFKGERPYITAGVVVSRLDDVQNASIHRLMVLNKTELVARLVPPRHTYIMHQKAAQRGEPLPVAIVIGMDPITLFASCTRVPVGEEFNYASALRGEPVKLMRCENGVAVPDAEIVLEGYMHPTKRAKEGPFVDITGTYDIVREEPVIELTRMIRRSDPIYHGIIPSGGEHRLLMGVPYEPSIYKAVESVTKVKNVVLTEGGCCYLHAVVQIEKQTESDGKKAIMMAFAAHTSLKHVLIVDEDIDIFDPRELEYAVATRMRGDRDILILPHVRGSSLDPCCTSDGVSTKVGVDATKTLENPERFERVF